MENKPKWYYSNPAIILLLILFFPVGLFLMWKYAKWSKKSKWMITGIWGIIVFVNLMSDDDTKNISTSQLSPTPQTQQQIQKEEKPTATPTPSQHELEAEVKFSDTAFQITNIEEIDWVDCKLEMNGGIIRSGYIYKKAVILAKEVVVIPFRDFAKGDGTRFNSYDTKPQSLSISCETKEGHGFGYYGM